MIENLNLQLKQIEESISKGLQNVTTLNINLNDLENNYFENRTELIKIETNCLYWFETENAFDGKILVDLLENKRTFLKDNIRIVPPKNKNQDSKVIYLGVRQGGKPTKDGSTKIGGRIFHHYGLYKIGTTQGLQLKYWAELQKINLKLNIIELEVENIKHLYIIEKMFSNSLKPLLGVH